MGDGGGGGGEGGGLLGLNAWYNRVQSKHAQLKIFCFAAAWAREGLVLWYIF